MHKKDLMMTQLFHKTILIMACLFVVTTMMQAQDATGDTTGFTTTTVAKKMNGWDYYAAGRYRESINALKQEKNQYPDRINIYVIMGWDYLELRNFSEMEKNISRGPQNQSHRLKAD
jgi:hypothetical protein